MKFELVINLKIAGNRFGDSTEKLAERIAIR
jgi:hypothetical protein